MNIRIERSYSTRRRNFDNRLRLTGASNVGISAFVSIRFNKTVTGISGFTGDLMFKVNGNRIINILAFFPDGTGGTIVSVQMEAVVGGGTWVLTGQPIWLNETVVWPATGPLVTI